MKNDPTPPQASELDAQRRPAPARRRPAPPRHGGADAARLRHRRRAARRCGAARSGLEPADVDPARAAALRAGAVRAPRRSPRPSARKLAALRQLFASCASTARCPRTPPTSSPAPKRPSKLPRVLAPAQIAALLDRIPATTPLELRDRALFELAYACGLRAEELVDLDVATSSTSTARRCASRARARKTRLVPAGEAALRAVAR